MYSGSHLIHVDDSPWNITASEDQDNDNQNPGNSLVSLLPGGGLGDASGRHGDEPVDVTVDCTEDKEGDEHHHHKVGNENVVSAVTETFSHCSRANRNFARRLKTFVDDHFLTFTGEVENLSLVHFQTSLKFIKPGDVENSSEENYREDVRQT